MLRGWPTLNCGQPPQPTHLDWSPLACLLDGCLYSSIPGLLGRRDPKPLESSYYKHMFETEFPKASTPANASGMSHRYHSSHSSHCLRSHKSILVSGGHPGWGGPRSSLLRLTSCPGRLIGSVPVGLLSPAGLYPAPSHRMSSQLLHVEFRMQGPPTVWIRGSTSPEACLRSTLTSSKEGKVGG